MLALAVVFGAGAGSVGVGAGGDRHADPREDAKKHDSATPAVTDADAAVVAAVVAACLHVTPACLRRAGGLDQPRTFTF